MKIALQSQENFNEIAFVNLDLDTFEIVSKLDPKVKTNGYYSVREDNIICFFRLAEKLYIKLGDVKLEFQENDKVLLDPLGNNHFMFSIIRGQEKILTWDYIRSEIYPDVSAMQLVNPMASEEDFDIFILIYNVMNNVERRKKVFRLFQT